MSKIIDFVKDNPKYSIAAGLVLAALSYTGIASMPGSRQEVFSGRVGDWNVVYEEGKKDNYLTATMGKTSVKYLDSNAPTSIGLFDKTPVTLADSVERIVYQDSKGETTTFDVTDVDTTRFDSDARNAVFANGNAHYNALRTQVREIKRKDTLSKLEEVAKNLK